MRNLTFSLSISLLTFFRNNSYCQNNADITLERFIQETEISYTNTINICILGNDRIQDDDLHKFSAIMLKDCILGTFKLAQLAKKRGIKLENSMKYDNLTDTNEVDIDLSSFNYQINKPLKNKFDISFLQMAIEDYQVAIELFNTAMIAKDCDLKIYCENIMPLLKRNHIVAQSFIRPSLAAN